MSTVNAFGPRQSRPARRNALLLALLATLSLSACGGGDEDGDEGVGAPEMGTSAPSPGPSPTAGDHNASARNGIPIRITFGNTELTARLDDKPTARDLSAQLPLTLTFRDQNNVEKTAPLPRELSLDGAPEGHDPAAGDIGYWAPGGDLVSYYDSEAPFFNGIVRIGEFDGDTDAIERLNQAETVAVGCDRLPEAFHGKGALPLRKGGGLSGSARSAPSPANPRGLQDLTPRP